MVFTKVVLSFVLFFFIIFTIYVPTTANVYDRKSLNLNDSTLPSIEFPQHPSFNSVSSSSSLNTGCRLQSPKANTLKASQTTEPHQDNGNNKQQSVKLNLKHRSANEVTETGKKESVIESSYRDLTRIQTLHRRIIEKKNKNVEERSMKNKNKKHPIKPVVIAPESHPGISESKLVATLESGVSLGSGEYFMDVFIGSPPKHFSLILDTGSDLNWIQCLPCHDCFEQNGAPYNPKESSSFRNISCNDRRCQLVSSPDPPQPCKLENQSCPYFYWYGDRSNTTGDFALETFTVNLTSPTGETQFREVENVMFGCGHWNRGLFHGAAGLLGLGRGPLSFSSQLQSLYGHTFSYCLVDRNSDISVSSKLIFGEDQSLMSHPHLNFTSLVAGKENSVDTFYYVQIKGIMVGGELLDIPVDTWKLSSEGAGGTIIDSGTTLSYFAHPAYKTIKEAFLNKTQGYPVVQDFPVLEPCYNVSGVEKVELPDFSILFEDGAVWNFPVENYFIRLDPEDIVCLAILGTPKSSLSILGNYQQQNFHIMYDTKKSRLGFAPMKCADV
ncbi:Aspartyl protease family protein [Thalictrum thalictroides]|uniref:Aspartyl protease family protein n=1 Tax=Thalictrum thalictroides TaxID=46969 RepID=A0A7J6VRY8_THATH|nr:Aspartyl protease family protein [Thalictrum thalictroides]